MAVSIWVLADDRAGNVNQALGVAEALGLPFEVKDIRYGRLGGLPNLVLGASVMGLTAGARAGLAPPWPDLVISAGRRTAPVARWIKRKAGGGARLVQIMHPGGGGLADFDLIAVPNHDSLRSVPANVLRITGAPHRITARRLAAERERWRERFQGLPRPLIALIVGGATKNRPFPPEMAATLGAMTATLAQSGGGTVCVTTSRRTGAASEDALLAALPERGLTYRWGDTGENPYFGLLASADGVVVTGDSTSMLSEACATGGPLHVFAPPGWAAPKHARLHAELYRLGLARPLGLTLEPWTHLPLNAAEDIAAAIRLFSYPRKVL